MAAAVEQDLRDAGAEVEDGADVAEDLAPEAEVQGRGLVIGVGVFVVVVVGFGGGGEVVACDSGDDYEEDGGAVEEDCLGPGAGCGGFGWIGGGGGGGGGFGVHGSCGGEHCAVEAVEAVAVGGLGAGAVCFRGGAVGVAG